MSGRGLFWIKNENSDELDYKREPPFPSFNAAGNLIDSYAKKYLSLSMVEQYFERYIKAGREIKQRYDEQREMIKELQGKVIELENKLSKWERQQGKGRRPDKRLHSRENDVRTWKAEGISNREIARRLGVSEGSIRKILKVSTDGLKNALP
jgi:DNA-binding NarL/FixJ family response regulator